MFMLNGGRDTTISNNIFVDGGHFVEASWLGFFPTAYSPIAQKNIDLSCPPWSTAFPKLVKFASNPEGIGRPEGNIIENNLYYKTKDMRFYGWPENEPQDIVTIKNNYKAEEDPFVDIEKLDFRLKGEKDSIVYKKIPGFERIPFEKIGLYKDEYRK